MYAPTESLFSELSSYQDPITKDRLLTQELMKKYKVVILGPNTLSAYLLKVITYGIRNSNSKKYKSMLQKFMIIKEKTISTRFSSHVNENIYKLRKKLEDADVSCR